MSKATEVEADATVVQAWLDVRAVGDDSIADEVSGWASDPTGLDPPADSRADGGGVAGDGPGVGPDAKDIVEG